MYIRNREGKVIFDSSDTREFIPFVRQLAVENGDEDMSITVFGEAEDYLANYCPSLYYCQYSTHTQESKLANLEHQYQQLAKEYEELVRTLLPPEGYAEVEFTDACGNEITRVSVTDVVGDDDLTVYPFSELSMSDLVQIAEALIAENCEYSIQSSNQ